MLVNSNLFLLFLDVSSLTQAQTNENNQSDTYLDGQNNIYSQLAVQNNHYQQQDMCLLTNDMNKIADFPSSYTSNGYDVNLQSNYSQYFDDTLSNFKPIYEQSMCQPTYENQIQETYIPTYHQLPYQQENISSVYQQAFEPEYGNIQPIYQLQNNHPIYQQENINPSWSLPSYDMSFGPNEANTNIECLPSTTALPEAPLASGSGMIAFKEEPIIPLVLKNPPPMSMNDDFSPQAKNFILHDDEGHNFPIRIQVRVLQEATDQNTQKQYMLIPIIGDLPEGNDFNFIDLKSEVIERINTLSQGKSILLPLGIENAMNQGIRITRRSPVQMTTERCFDSSGISSTFSSPTNTEDCQVVRPAAIENLVIVLFN